MSNTLPSTITTSLRDVAESVADAATSAAHSISSALPSSFPDLPSSLPLVGHTRSKRRSSTPLLITAAVVGVALAGIALRQYALRRTAALAEPEAGFAGTRPGESDLSLRHDLAV